ncbi:MAG: hypothetical protein HXY34_06665 [Candidatus Thorarchaeota archaeon]|nr:hypothetical protein [Candidatus Thorarchaeota archaeon]
MRIHDINVVADVNRHDPSNPDPSEPEAFDGSPEGVAEGTAGKSFVMDFQSIAEQALMLQWMMVWWPILRITANLAFLGLTFLLTLDIDLLGSMTVQSCSFLHTALESMTEEEQDRALALTLSLTTIQQLELVILASSSAASFFATFQLLPQAKLLFTAALITWTLASMMLIYTMAEYFLNGMLSQNDAAFSLFVLAVGLFFADLQLATQAFGRVFGFLNKYRISVPDWGYHDTAFTACRLLVFLLALAVLAAIACS